MNKNAALILIGATVGLGLLGLATHLRSPSHEAPPTPMEFVCYEDGVLSERHVLVEHAANAVGSSLWQLTYTDGQMTSYNQKAGESCQLEIPPKEKEDVQQV